MRAEMLPSLLIEYLGSERELAIVLGFGTMELNTSHKEGCGTFHE